MNLDRMSRTTLAMIKVAILAAVVTGAAILAPASTKAGTDSARLGSIVSQR